jgi:phospholipid/cholesterol/gamma-HCH transport system substrate-binding protein
MKGKGSRSLIVGIVIAVVLVAGMTFAVVATRASSAPSHQMQIDFPSADGLVAGSDVLEAGAKIGYISDIEPTQTNSALVTVQISGDHWPIHTGVSATIRPKSLLGEKYVALQDGGANNAVFDASVTIHANQTAVPVELDQFINSLDTPTRTAVRVLLDDLGAGVAGRGNDLNAAIAAGKADLSNLAVFGTTLNNRDADLDKILVGLDGLLAKLTTSDQLTQMSQLITNGQNVLNDIEKVSTSFSRQFVDANNALTDLNVAFDGAVPSLRSTLDISSALVSNLQTETGLLGVLASTVNASQSTEPSISGLNPLQMLEAGLQRGPTVSGGALEFGNPLTPGGAPIFRICLSNIPTNPASSASCTNPNSPPTNPTAGFRSGAGNAALFAAFLGA